MGSQAARVSRRSWIARWRRQDSGDSISQYPMPEISSLLQRRYYRNGSPRSPESRERQLDLHPARRLRAQR